MSTVSSAGHLSENDGYLWLVRNFGHLVAQENPTAEEQHSYKSNSRFNFINLPGFDPSQRSSRSPVTELSEEQKNQRLINYHKKRYSEAGYFSGEHQRLLTPKAQWRENYLPPSKSPSFNYQEEPSIRDEEATLPTNLRRPTMTIPQVEFEESALTKQIASFLFDKNARKRFDHHDGRYLLNSIVKPMQERKY